MRRRPEAIPSIGGAMRLLAVLVGVTGIAVYLGSVPLALRSLEDYLVRDSTRLADAAIAAVNAVSA